MTARMINYNSLTKRSSFAQLTHAEHCFLNKSIQHCTVDPHAALESLCQIYCHTAQGLAAPSAAFNNNSMMSQSLKYGLIFPVPRNFRGLGSRLNMSLMIAT